MNIENQIGPNSKEQFAEFIHSRIQVLNSRFLCLKDMGKQIRGYRGVTFRNLLSKLEKEIKKLQGLLNKFEKVSEPFWSDHYIQLNKEFQTVLNESNRLYGKLEKRLKNSIWGYNAKNKL